VQAAFPYLRHASIIAGLLLCLCSIGPSDPTQPLVICDGSPGPSVPHARRFGIFSESFWGNYPSQLDSITGTLGAIPGFVLWFQPIDRAFPQVVVSENAFRGIGTIISMDIKSSALDSLRNDTLLKEISLGIWDSTLHAFAGQAKKTGAPVFFRFGYEMNGDWFPWGKKRAEYVSAWRHAHRLFTDDGAGNVAWIFSPNIMWDTMTVAGSILPYYPGDSMVDIVGCDGYNFGDSVNDHRWESFEEIFGTTLLGLESLGKPLWITEIGCARDSRRLEWLYSLLKFMDVNPCIGALIWFDAHKSGEPDFQLTNDSASLAMVRSWLQQ